MAIRWFITLSEENSELPFSVSRSAASSLERPIWLAMPLVACRSWRAA
ncbi:MAG: hypothetical protein R3D33_14745 [Hyphomicrobiaceae bacterium]